jgi:dienelactone hydrolase
MSRYSSRQLSNCSILSRSIWSRPFFCCLFLLLAGLSAQADNLVNFARTDTLSVAETNKRLKTVLGGYAPVDTTQPIDLYKVRYNSPNGKGKMQVVTGLVALPRGGAPKGLVIFSHGTIGDHDMSPSRWTTKLRVGEAQGAILAFATGGYALAMPDYLGLGDDNGPHPFPLGHINSRSAIDIITPARGVANKSGVKVGPKLFLTGYSEGGAVTMWATKQLEARGVPIAASAPISGPYDLTETTRKGLLSPPKTIVEFAAQLYFMTFAVRYFHATQGVPLTDYFVPRIANLVETLYDKGYSDETMIKYLVLNALTLGANNSLEKIITPRFSKAITELDTSDPVLRELKNSDCFDWSPKTKMLLVSLDGDNIVDPANMTVTIDTMRKRGVGPGTLRSVVVKNAALTHLNAPARMAALARKFFDGGFTGVGAK